MGVFSTFQAPNQTANSEEIITMNFYKYLQLDYENKALKWSVNFQGPEFDIPEKLKEDVALIGDMCKDVVTRRNEVENLRDEIAQKEQDIGLKINILEKKHKEKHGNDEVKNAELRSYVDRAKDHLGISLARTSTESYVLILTNIDMANPTRTFLCEFQLGGINKTEYKVMRCEPEIEGIKDMEKKVNETNDISGFVVTLRKKFKAISASL